MTKYWIGVASKEHVKRGVKGGFAQVCHGKPGPLEHMSEGDWIVYYSPTVEFGGKNRCQSFTAIGKIKAAKPYLFERSVRRNPDPLGAGQDELSIKKAEGVFRRSASLNREESPPFMEDVLQMSHDFIPWRRDVTFLESKEVPIQQLLERLSFIKDKKRWGFPFRCGCFEIFCNDFELIAKAMEVVIE